MGEEFQMKLWGDYSGNKPTSEIETNKDNSGETDTIAKNSSDEVKPEVLDPEKKQKLEGDLNVPEIKKLPIKEGDLTDARLLHSVLGNGIPQYSWQLFKYLEKRSNGKITYNRTRTLLHNYCQVAEKKGTKYLYSWNSKYQLPDISLEEPEFPDTIVSPTGQVINISDTVRVDPLPDIYRTDPETPTGHPLKKYVQDTEDTITGSEWDD